MYCGSNPIFYRNKGTSSMWPVLNETSDNYIQANLKKAFDSALMAALNKKGLLAGKKKRSTVWDRIREKYFS